MACMHAYACIQLITLSLYGYICYTCICMCRYVSTGYNKGWCYYCSNCASLCLTRSAARTSARAKISSVLLRRLHSLILIALRMSYEFGIDVSAASWYKLLISLRMRLANHCRFLLNSELQGWRLAIIMSKVTLQLWLMQGVWRKLYRVRDV